MMKSYSSYTNSKIPDVDQVPDSWSEKRFRYIFDTMKGLTITKENLQDEGIPCINYGEVHSKYGFEVDTRRDKLRFVSEDYLVTNRKSLLQKGDLIFADTSEDVEGSGNFTQLINDGQAFAGYHTIIARPKNGYHPRFLAYFIESTAFRSQVQRAIKGVKVFSITNAILKSSLLLIPTLKEQQVIASYLDRQTHHIDNLIIEKQNFINLLEEKRQALISHVVTKGIDDSVEMKDSGVEWIGGIPSTWSVSKLGFNLEAIGDVDHYMPDSIEHGIPYVMTGDLMENASDIRFDACKQVSQEDYLKLSKKIRTSAGDVIMARYATIGTVSYVDIDKKFLVSYSCVTIKPKKSILVGRYLFYYLKSDALIQGVQSHVNTNTQRNVGIGDLRKVKIAVPDTDSQNQIVTFLDKSLNKIDLLTEETSRSVELLKERRSALISAAVTGKIDVREAV